MAVPPGTDGPDGFGNAGVEAGTYLSVAVDADGSIQIGRNTATQTDQSLIDAINSNESGNPLADTLNYVVSDGATSVTDTATLDLTDISYTTGNAPPFTNADTLSPGETVAVQGLAISIPASDDGNAVTDPTFTVGVSLGPDSSYDEGSLGMTQAAAGSTVTPGAPSPGAYGGVSSYFITGTLAAINADLSDLTFRSAAAGSNQLVVQTTEMSGGNTVQSTNFTPVGSFQVATSASEPVAMQNTYDTQINPGTIGFGGGLAGTEAGGTAGITVVSISSDGVNFSPVTQDGMTQTTVDGTYESFSSDSNGDSSTTLLESSQDLINAINNNDIDGGTGPLSDSFYYDVTDGAGNYAVDEVTSTYGDVNVTTPTGVSYGNAENDTLGQSISLAGFTESKDLSTDANATNPDLVNPNLSIDIGAFDFATQTAAGTFSITGDDGATVTATEGNIQITGTEAQINADLASLTYTGDTPGDYNILVTTTDDSSSNFSYQSATYVDGSIDVSCFCRGTRIMTAQGEVPIEKLAAGDEVTIGRPNAQATQRVLWTGHREIDCTRHPNPRAVWPVLIEKDAFAQGKPARDLCLSPGHSVFAEGVLMQAENLVNGTTIRQVRCDRVDYWHVELESHDVLLSDGLPTESYLDTGNRTAFEGGGAYLELHPDFSAKHWSDTCVPLVFEGAAIERTRTELLARAKRLGHMLAADADVHVMALGRRFEPVQISTGRVAFMLPPGCERIQLRSRTFTPAHVRAASRDQRALGVCVKRLQIDGQDVPMDEAALAEGWHALEWQNDCAWRWTSGRTAFAAGTRLIVIDIHGGGEYWQEKDEPDVVVRVNSAR